MSPRVWDFTVWVGCPDRNCPRPKEQPAGLWGKKTGIREELFEKSTVLFSLMQLCIVYPSTIEALFMTMRHFSGVVSFVAYVFDVHSWMQHWGHMCKWRSCSVFVYEVFGAKLLKQHTSRFACLRPFITNCVYFILLLTIFQSRPLVPRQSVGAIHFSLTINLWRYENMVNLLLQCGLHLVFYQNYVSLAGNACTWTLTWTSIFSPVK